jgi:mannose-6-phosphate isomerase-like protein (cupin superfamily)
MRKSVSMNGTITEVNRWITKGYNSTMARYIKFPSTVEAAGNKPKIIEEYFGRVNSGTPDVSIARMKSPGGWVEPGQRPEFTEYTVILRGRLRVLTKTGSFDLWAGEAIVIDPGEWVQYSSPEDDGAEYISVCLPAFSPATVHRDRGK